MKNADNGDEDHDKDTKSKKKKERKKVSDHTFYSSMNGQVVESKKPLAVPSLEGVEGFK